MLITFTIISPAYNVQRACGTSLEAAYQIFAKISLGTIDSGIAGGVDANTDAPFEIKNDLRDFILKFRSAKSFLQKISLIFSLRRSDIGVIAPVVVEPRTGLSMGEHCELMVKEWKVSRLEQDMLALSSHQNASRAFLEGFYNDLLVPVGNIIKDSFVRDDSSLEKLTKLSPVFDKKHGSITAGNASPLSDGTS